MKWTGFKCLGFDVHFESIGVAPGGLPVGVRQPDTLTPIEAMSLLYELKKKLQ